MKRPDAHVEAEALPEIPRLSESGLAQIAADHKAPTSLDGAIEQYQRCMSTLSDFVRWKRDAFENPQLRAVFEEFLEAGGDPHWEDARPFRGTDELKVWGERVKAVMSEAGDVQSRLYREVYDSFHQSLQLLGASLGAEEALKEEPLYLRVSRAVAAGDQVRREHLDGRRLFLAPGVDRGVNEPFRDALAKSFGLTPKALMEMLGAADAAIDVLASGEVYPHTWRDDATRQAHEELLANGFSNADAYRPLVERRANLFREGHSPAMPEASLEP